MLKYYIYTLSVLKVLQVTLVQAPTLKNVFKIIDNRVCGLA